LLPREIGIQAPVLHKRAYGLSIVITSATCSGDTARHVSARDIAAVISRAEGIAAWHFDQPAEI
jgi:hypothetical protein